MGAGVGGPGVIEESGRGGQDHGRFSVVVGLEVCLTPVMLAAHSPHTIDTFRANSAVQALTSDRAVHAFTSYGAIYTFTSYGAIQTFGLGRAVQALGLRGAVQALGLQRAVDAFIECPVKTLDTVLT